MTVWEINKQTRPLRKHRCTSLLSFNPFWVLVRLHWKKIQYGILWFVSFWFRGFFAPPRHLKSRVPGGGGCWWCWLNWLYFIMWKTFDVLPKKSYSSIFWKWTFTNCISDIFGVVDSKFLPQIPLEDMDLHIIIAISNMPGMQVLCRAIQSFVNRNESAELYLSLFLGISLLKL